MDKKTEETMIANLLKNTGKSIDQWIEIAKTHNTGKHGETVKILKEKYDLGLFFADLIVHKLNGTDSGSASADELIEKQYKGKEQLRPVYDKIMEEVLKLGDDVEVAPKNAYVSLRRKKQFACLSQPPKQGSKSNLSSKGKLPKVFWNLYQGLGLCVLTKLKLKASHN